MKKSIELSKDRQATIVQSVSTHLFRTEGETSLVGFTGAEDNNNIFVATAVYTHTHTYTHKTHTHKTDIHTHTHKTHTHKTDTYTHTHKTHTHQADTHTHTYTHTHCCYTINAHIVAIQQTFTNIYNKQTSISRLFFRRNGQEKTRFFFQFSRPFLSFIDRFLPKRTPSLFSILQRDNLSYTYIYKGRRSDSTYLYLPVGTTSSGQLQTNFRADERVSGYYKNIFRADESVSGYYKNIFRADESVSGYYKTNFRADERVSGYYKNIFRADERVSGTSILFTIRKTISQTLFTMEAFGVSLYLSKDRLNKIKFSII
jgi:hypothetical protein